MLDMTLERQAESWTRQLIEQAVRHFDLPISQPRVRFDLRGKAAGMALFHPRGETVIRYNTQMLKENGQAFIAQTVPHEVAHLVARAVFGPAVRPHGAEWRSIMTLFGAEPRRCHGFAVPRKDRRKMRYFTYRCACRDHSLSAIRHHRSLSGVVYICRLCGSPLRSTSDAPA
jgi:SprT protein